MSSDSLTPQFDQSFPAAIPQVPAEKKPRKKRLRSVIHHERRDSGNQYAAARREKNEKTFEQVLQTYLEVSSLSPLGASAIDPLSKRNGLTFVHVEWSIDVQSCAKSVLSPFLHKKWQALLSIESQDFSDEQKRTALSAAGITPQVIHRLQQKLGPAFHSRELAPGAYFRTIRRRNRFEKVREQEIKFSEVHDANSVHTSDDLPVLENGYGIGVIEPQDRQQEE